MIDSSGASRRPDTHPSATVPNNPSAKAARFLNRTFPRIYASLSLAPRFALAYRWLRQLEKAKAGRRLSQLALKYYRTSDTVFIFGTGASINDYPEEYWNVVRHHDSIGMNFFLLHEHVPTIHVMENVTGVHRSLLAARYAERGDYQGTPLIMKTQLSNLSPHRVAARIAELRELHPDVLAHTYLSLDLLAAGKTRADMEGAYRLSGRLGLWKPKPRFLLLTKRRGSVSYIVNLAVRAGYRRLVLCGVDLNHTEHFYDSRREELEATGLPVPPNREAGTMHSTNDPANHPVTIHSVLMAIKKQILDPAGIELFVGSETSALYPDLPAFDWKRAVAALDDERA